MQAYCRYHAGMARQLTVRNVPDEVGLRLDRISRARGKSLNSLVLDILAASVGADARRGRLERYATWTEAEALCFDAALGSQRVVDAD